MAEILGIDEDFLAGALPGGLQPDVSMFAVRFPTSPQAGSFQWRPGAIHIVGFWFDISGTSMCISIDGTLAADSFDSGTRSGILYKTGQTSSVGPWWFPGAGFKVQNSDTVYLSKNQANVCGIYLAYTRDDG